MGGVERRTKARLVAALAAAILVAAGVWIVVGLLAGESDAGRDGVASNAENSGASAAAPSGPERLREGARQNLDPVSGRAAAVEALARVEAELAEAEDEAEGARLRRKRDMIRQAIDRLEDPGR
ncbi:MAG: hypothetical protein HY905_18435 [Deltaproteobacteria bacterium]|nr:hypothetical protein [Deltaproteobacteria bacterium]